MTRSNAARTANWAFLRNCDPYDFYEKTGSLTAEISAHSGRGPWTAGRRKKDKSVEFVMLAHDMKRLILVSVMIVIFAGVFCSPGGGQVTPEKQVSSVDSTANPEKHHWKKDLKHYLAKVQPWLDRYGYAAVFVAVMVEGCGIPAPGQTLLMAGSFAAAAKELNIVALLLVTMIAALLGNSLGYFLGRWGGRAILYKFKVNEQRMGRIEALFSRYGGGVILIARFLDGLRQLNGITAGILEMPWWLFTVYNVLGAVLWTCFWGLGLFYLDENIYAFHRAFDHVRLWIALAVILSFALLTIYVLRRRNRNTDPARRK